MDKYISIMENSEKILMQIYCDDHIPILDTIQELQAFTSEARAQLINYNLENEKREFQEKAEEIMLKYILPEK
ncbi:hypothetical protein OXYTRIMIC_242 [Oxytricha trifallax]|uniref:Uncharacterized protein n=1 Tax=Oxytricha trifallax TaxID=1172189 RepID=A0A073HXV8_9SPIT|nr:hypothetical protein OXYTRIMIC_242 [Oxytricha trifallax]